MLLFVCVQSTCVRSGVPLQLVTARETFPTENPVADEGSFTSVQPDMSSEQRCFPKSLFTARDVADVFPLSHLTGSKQWTKFKPFISMRVLIVWVLKSIIWTSQNVELIPTHPLTDSPLVCIFTVGASAGHASFLFSWLARQLQGEGLVYLNSRLALCCGQLEPSTLHGLHR